MLYDILSETNKLQEEIGMTNNELLAIVVINELDKRGISATSTNARRFGLSCAPNIFSNLKKRGIIVPTHKTYAYKLSITYKRYLSDLEERMAAQLSVGIKNNPKLADIARSIVAGDPGSEQSETLS